MKKLKHMLYTTIALVLILTTITLSPVHAETNGETIITVPITVQEEYTLAEDFFVLLNQKREEAGKYEYILDDKLMSLAMERAAQCCIYFSHGSMTYERQEHFALEGTYIDEYGAYEDFFNGQLFQENIAEGLADAQSTFTVWNNSSGHNAVMMDVSNFKYCGIGVVTYHGKREWVLVTSKKPVGTPISQVSGSETKTRTVRAKAKYFSRVKVAALDEWADRPFAFSDIESGWDGYHIQQTGIFTFKNNNPELFDIDSMGRLKPKANGKGSFSVYYGDYELCTVSVTSYHDEEPVAPTPTPTQTPKPTETPVPTQTPKPTVKPTQPPKQPEAPVSRSFTVKVKNVTYNGKAQRPAVTVYDGNEKLSQECYAVSYKNNKNVGYGTVVVSGKGTYSKYSGTAEFKINFKKPSLSSAKSTKKKTLTVSWKKTGGNSGWQVQYSINRKFRSEARTVILKAGKTKTTIKKLKSRKTYYIRIRGYKNVGGKRMYSGWSNVKKVKIK